MQVYGGKTKQNKPPDRGAFPLDHHAECGDHVRVSKRALPLLLTPDLVTDCSLPTRSLATAELSAVPRARGPTTCALQGVVEGIPSVSYGQVSSRRFSSGSL